MTADNDVYQEQRACECEHVRHFPDYDGVHGHNYGAPQSAVALYQTPWGTFALCHWCWEVCHDGTLTRVREATTVVGDHAG